MLKISESNVENIEVIYMTNQVLVSKVRHIQTRNILCQKKIKLTEKIEHSAILNELLAMASIDHENILKLISYSFSGTKKQLDSVIIYTEFCEEGNLEDYISYRKSKKSPFSVAELKYYISQIVAALWYLQNRGIAHRDIKPQNIFLKDQKTKIIIGDLGSASLISNKQEMLTIVGTPLYLSPSIRRNYHNNLMLGVYHDAYKSDVYSLGLVFLYMVSLTPPNDLAVFDGLEEKIEERLNKIENKYFLIRKLIEKMLKVDESQRFDFFQLQNYLNVNFSVSSEIDLSVKGKVIYEDIRGCLGCGNVLEENQMFVFYCGLICRECYSGFFMKSSKVKMVHVEGSHEMAFKFDCLCLERLQFCWICKRDHDLGVSCALGANGVKNRLGISCNECGRTVRCHDTSMFFSCANHHYYCVACLEGFNVSDHEVCRVLFMGSL